MSPRAALDGDPTPRQVAYAEAAAFYTALIANDYLEEATEFAEWFLDTFDLDLEE